MIHWLQYNGSLCKSENAKKQLLFLQSYLQANPTAKVTGYWKTTGDMFAKFVRLECEHNYMDLDIDCNSGNDSSLRRFDKKPCNLEYSETVTNEINDFTNAVTQ